MKRPQDFDAIERAWENSQEEVYHQAYQQACADAEIEEELRAEEFRKDTTHTNMGQMVDAIGAGVLGWDTACDACDAAAEDRWEDAVVMLHELVEQDQRWVPLRDFVIAANHETAESTRDSWDPAP